VETDTPTTPTHITGGPINGGQSGWPPRLYRGMLCSIGTIRTRPLRAVLWRRMRVGTRTARRWSTML
jgi:hypothetical protein